LQKFDKERQLEGDGARVVVPRGRHEYWVVMLRISLMISMAMAAWESPAAEAGASPFHQHTYVQLISVKIFAFGEVGGGRYGRLRKGNVV
jgi:hypothetical protein